MLIYLASSFSRQDEMQIVARRLEQFGHFITSSWLYEDQSLGVQAKRLRNCAIQDLADVDACSLFIRFADDLSEPKVPSHLATGARHFEMGYAAARGKPLVVVGGRNSIFDFLPQVIKIADFDALLRYLAEEEIN